MERPGVSDATEPCEGCADVAGEGVAERTLAAWLRLLCGPCLHELVQLQPSRRAAESAPDALRRLTAAAATELGRRILERDRV